MNLVFNGVGMADKKYDVFLSFNSEDRAEVEQIAIYLKERILNPWFDQWELIPGEQWIQSLWRGLDASATCAVFVGKNGEGPWQNREVERALMQQIQHQEFRVIPVLLPDASKQPILPSFLSGNMWVDFRGKGLDDNDALWRLECGIRGVPPGPGPVNPPGKFAKAMADFNRVLDSDPNNVVALSGRGEIYRQMGQYAEAMADFNRVLDSDHNNVWVLRSRGTTYRQMGQYAEAMADLSRALDSDSNNVFALSNRGETYRLMGQYTEAMTDFNRVLDSDPNNVWVLAIRGATHGQMGQYMEAKADFDRAIALDPSYVYALTNRGVTYSLMKKYQEALKDLNHALAIEPNNIDALTQRGEVYRLMSGR
jgi:Tfp pilus assembly protein PilF